MHRRITQVMDENIQQITKMERAFLKQGLDNNKKSIRLFLSNAQSA